MDFESCEGCVFHDHPECKRFPPDFHGYPKASRGCGEFRAKEVIPCPAVEQAVEKAEEKVVVVEKASEPGTISGFLNPMQPLPKFNRGKRK